MKTPNFKTNYFDAREWLTSRVGARMLGSLALLVGIWLSGSSVFAAPQYFSDAGGPKPWDTTTANWGAVTTGPYSAAWGSGNSPTFEGTGGTVNVGSGASSPTCITPVTFSVNNYILTGGEIKLSGAVNIIASTAGSNTISSVLSGAGTVKFQGSSGSSYNYLINGANAFTGVPTIQAAQVFFDTLKNGGVASSFGQGSSSTAVALVANSSFTRAVYVGSGGGTDRPWQINGTGAGSIFSSGSGAISFNNTGSACGGTAGIRSLTLLGTYTAAANTFAETLNDTGTSPNITSLTVSGNTWNITGNNTHSGGTSLTNSGVLNIGHVNALGTGAFTQSGNGSFDNTTGGDIVVNNDFTLSGGSPTYVGSANSMAINGATTISGANRSITVSDKTLTLGGAVGEDVGGRSLTIAGSGTLALYGVNTYSGGTLISGTGTLLVTNDTGLGSSSAGLTFSGSGTLAATNNGAAANNTVTIGSSRTITVNSSKTANFTTPDTNNLIIAAKITGAGGVKRFASGSSFALGTVRFGNDNNDYTGEFTVNQGHTEFTSVANVGTASSLGKGTTGIITIANNNAGGFLTYVGSANSSTTRPLNWTSRGSYSLENNGSGTIAWLSSSSLRSSDINPASLTLGGSNTGTNTLAQVINEIAGATTLTKVGVGRWILTGVNTYSGSTTINAGELTGNTAGSCASSAVTVASGATNGVQLAAANGQWTCGGLTYSAGTTYADFDFTATAPSTTVAPLNISGNLAVNATVKVIARSGSALTAGTSYPLITWTGTGPADLSGFGTLTLPSAMPGTLTLNTGTKTISVMAGIHVPNLAYTNASGTGRQIALADITTAGLASSAGSPTYTITLPSGTSANGGSVITDGSQILYEPSGSPTSDSFSYTVSDGTATATATVNLTFQNQASGSHPEITVSGGVVNGTLYGIPSVQYDVQRATAVDGPYTTVTSGLTPANPITAAGDGKISFTDTTPPPVSGFYRTIQH